MNKNLSTILKLITLVAVLLLVAGCKKAPIQETQAVETMEATAAVEVPVTTVTEETAVIETEPPVTAPEAGSITYEEYLELTVEEQQAYYRNFETADDFFAWMDAAKAEYDAATEPIETFGSANNNEEEEVSNDSESDSFFEEEFVEDW